MITEFQGEYRWLSNFWPVTIQLDALIYPTVEHAYQAAKTLKHDERLIIQNCKTPGKAKAQARHLTQREGWKAVKDAVMTSLIRQKFSHEPLRTRLLATGSQEIQEGNCWNDTYWGVCRGVGQNKLGVIIMQIREELS